MKKGGWRWRLYELMSGVSVRLGTQHQGIELIRGSGANWWQRRSDEGIPRSAVLLAWHWKLRWIGRVVNWMLRVVYIFGYVAGTSRRRHVDTGRHTSTWVLALGTGCIAKYGRPCEQNSKSVWSLCLSVLRRSACAFAGAGSWPTTLHGSRADWTGVRCSRARRVQDVHS